ncbi:hypothetical protein C6A37_12955, partial [Desulfobacteraceae bacterium SEEP-SAG9]
SANQEDNNRQENADNHSGLYHKGTTPAYLLYQEGNQWIEKMRTATARKRKAKCQATLGQEPTAYNPSEGDCSDERQPSSDKQAKGKV